jgi:hypothetical protein
MAGAFINQANLDPDTRRDETPHEFNVFGEEVLNSEELTDLAYRAFLTLMAKRYQSSPWGCHEDFNHDIADLLLNGMYLPCVRRVTYAQQVDQRNDGLPDFAAVFDVSDRGGRFGKGTVFVHQVRRVDRFPIGVAAPAAGAKFKYVCWERSDALNRHEKRFFDGENDTLVAFDSYLTITPGDRVVHGLATRVKWQREAMFNAASTVWPAMVFNAWADRHHLWQVRTQDHVIQHLETPLTLGVAEEHIKSLFYARSLPVTETGRKRPILHWVKAHARRLAEGIDVDVRKHLRGITEFEMDGLRFAIVSPDKENQPERIQ